MPYPPPPAAPLGQPRNACSHPTLHPTPLRPPSGFLDTLMFAIYRKTDEEGGSEMLEWYVPGLIPAAGTSLLAHPPRLPHRGLNP